MRVVHLITGLNVGGAEVMLEQLLMEFQRQEPMESAVVSLTDIGDVGKRLQGIGVPVYCLQMMAGFPDVRGLFRLRSVIREWKPDLVQTWLHHSDLLGGLVSCWERVPVVWGVHFSAPDSKNSNWLLRLTMRVCGWLSRCIPRAIVCCSKAAAQEHQGAGYDEKKIRVIPNGIRIDRFVPLVDARMELRKELCLSEDALLIGMAARFHPLKDHETFVEAAGLVAREYDNVHFVLCGAQVTPHNDELSTLIEQTGAGERFHLLGQRDDMPHVLAGLDIATLSSTSEALPLSLAEAMSCGVPCVATDVGDCGDLIGETGLVVRSSCSGELAQAWGEMLALSVEERSALGGRARFRVCELYSLEKTSQAYRNLYLEILGEGAN